VVRLLFRNFGLMSAENLARFMKFEMRMRELRSILADLEDEGLLVKGFLVRGDDTVHWMLARDAQASFPAPDQQLVLTPMDNLSYLLQPQIKERFGTWCYVILTGAEMSGAFRARKKGNDLHVTEVIGGPEAKRAMKAHVRLLGMTIREAEPDQGEDWELQDFYERTHPQE